MTKAQTSHARERGPIISSLRRERARTPIGSVAACVGAEVIDRAGLDVRDGAISMRPPRSKAATTSRVQTTRPDAEQIVRANPEHPSWTQVASAARYCRSLTPQLVHWHEQFRISDRVGCGRCIAWRPMCIDITQEVAVIAAGAAPPSGSGSGEKA